MLWRGCYSYCRSETIFSGEKILFEPTDIFMAMLPYYLFVMGAIFGSFANVIILRLPKGESIAKPSSRCMSCQTPIKWYDNIPIFSWFILRGQCRKCGAKFSFRYPAVELTMAIFFVLTYHFVGWNWFLLEALILVFGLVTVSVIDIDHYILPDVFTLSGIVIGLAGALLNPERSFLESLLGVLLGGGFLWSIAYFYLLLRKEEGMGGGDIKLLAWIGAVLGWKAIPFVIISSSLLGTVGGALVALRQKKGMKTVIPFGPYLALGAVIFLFGGSQIAFWYLSLFIPGLE